MVPEADQDPSPTISGDAAATTLSALTAAVAQRDVAAAADLTASSDAPARAQLSSLPANAESLKVEDFTLRYVDAVTGINAAGEWTAAVDATWRFDGYDDSPARAEILVDFVTSEGQTTIAGVGGGDRRTPVWMSGPVSVRSSADTLVLVAGEGRRIDGYQREAEKAIPTVRKVLDNWDGGLVIEVPANAAGVDQALAADDGRYANIAAVTASVDGVIAPDSPVHVFVNPDIFGQLDDQGAQVVMSHEAVHVATDAPTSRTPLWLLEGFADYVALRDVDLPVSTTAAQIAAQVRDLGLPQDLPDNTSFDTDETHLGAAYEAAWIACQVLVDRGGERQLVELYSRTRDGSELESDLQELFDWTSDDFVESWQNRLTRLTPSD
ncbi:hypothetical protein GCM10027020_00810 [Nocardioides salsibiostraticola]